MNIEQAERQKRLANNGSAGRDSQEEAPDNIISGDFGSKSEENTEDERIISKKTFVIVLIIAIILDLIGYAIDILSPFLGKSLVWVVGTPIMFLIFLNLGVKFHQKNVLKIAGCDLFE